MKRRPAIFAVTIVCLLFSNPALETMSAGRGFPSSEITPPQGVRDKLTAADLLSGSFPEVVHNDYFMPVGNVLESIQFFSGTLELAETEMNTTRPDSDWTGSGQRYFPAISLGFFRQGDLLIPLNRGIIRSGGQGRSYWNFIASPGRCWREAADNGWSRASFPFVLTDNFIGQALNGLATFVFTSAEISWVAVQITQETSPKSDYVRGDFNAAISARFIPRIFAEAGPAAAQYENEAALRPPVRNWSTLPSGGFTASFFNAGLDPEMVSFAALFLNGSLFLQPAGTRSGPYPYPLEMRHGVFSVTKTLVMGLSMFYFAERYGEGLFDERITAYVPELADHPGWQGVTFGNTLDMATGTQGDERNTNFIRARSASEKLQVVHGMPDAPYPPGARFEYSSSHTFTLSCALDRYVKAREGPESDYWDLVGENVLKPLGIPVLPAARTIEPGGAAGIPIAGWGCYPTGVEAVQIGRLLSNEGVWEGRQILNKNKVREALERTSRRGLSTGQPDSRYIHSLWILDVALSTGPITAPHMSGLGGNYVVVLPGELIAVRFADEDNRELAPMVAVAEFYRGLEANPGTRHGKNRTGKKAGF